MALSKRLRTELKSKDEEIERFNHIIEDLNSKWELVMKERDALALQCNVLYAERDSWLEERASFSLERSAWNDERAEKDLLLQERDSLAKERSTLSTERDSLLQERDGWGKERDAFSTEREALLNERESLQELIKQLIAETKSSALDLSIAKDKANLLTDQNSSLRDKNSALRLQVDRLETSVVTYKEEAKSYQVTVHQLEKRKESLKKDIIELQDYEKEIIEAHNEEREQRRYWRGMFESEAKRCEELKERFEEKETELEKVINTLREEMDDCRTQLALMEDWAGEMEEERRMLTDQIEAWKNGAAYEDMCTDVEAGEAKVFTEEEIQHEQEQVEFVEVNQDARDDGITPGDVKVAGDDSSPVNEDMDLEGLDLEEFEERVIAVNNDGEIVDAHEDSPSPVDPSERPVDPSVSRLFEEFDADNSLYTSQYRRYERIPEYHRAMEDLRHQRAKLDDYRVKLLEWKDELKKEQARYDEISQDLFERERDFYATVDQRDHHMAKLADEYDRWRTECEFKEAEVDEERLAVWRHQRELERRVERVKEREKMCRKREGEVRWRMICLDGALTDAEPKCWRCDPAPAHLFPPTPTIDYRDLDRHFEDLDEGQHESQLHWAEERNRRLREERQARLQLDVDEEYLREGEDEPFEFSGPEAVKRYLREERTHQKETREDESVDEEKEIEEWKTLKVENDKHVRECVEELMKEADEAKRLERREREKAECGDDGIIGVYDEALVRVLVWVIGLEY
jgi:chromosome segregation ATPase